MNNSKLNIIEVSILALSVIITGLVGLGQNQLNRMQDKFIKQQAAYERDRQSEQKTIDSLRNVSNLELQLMNFAKDFIPNISKTDEDGRIAKEVVLATSEYLSEEYGRATLSNIVSRIYEEQNSSRSNDGVDLFEVRIKESTISNSSKKKWFAVIASYDVDKIEYAKAFTLKFMRNYQVKQQGFNLQLWKTKISNMIAVTIDGELSREEASKRVNYVIENRWSEDAFVQVNRNWERVSDR